jgi:choline-phosphate cytidylyltransferase
MKYLGDEIENNWNSICAWGPTAMLPVFHLLGTKYVKKSIVSHILDDNKNFDGFTKIDFIYKNAVASIKVGKGAKSEGELIITGTKGYIYVPAPWWKTDYFEIRYENASDNRRYFYQLDGEGIRYEIVAFTKAIEDGKKDLYISEEVSEAISGVIGAFYDKEDIIYI